MLLHVSHRYLQLLYSKPGANIRVPTLDVDKYQILCKLFSGEVPNRTIIEYLFKIIMKRCCAY
jgi:hypothetical protein